MTSWLPTLFGAIAAVGLGLSQANIDPLITKIGAIMAVIGTALLGVVAKQWNVTGGSVPQATPPGIAAQSINQGIVEVEKAIATSTNYPETGKPGPTKIDIVKNPFNTG